MHTDFPEPVAPAIRRCGIFARSSMTGRPCKSLPIAIGSAARFSRHSRVSMSSRNGTTSGVGFGTSTPTAPLPGIGATILMLCARIARARSSASEANCEPYARCWRDLELRHTGPVVRPQSPLDPNVRSASITSHPLRPMRGCRRLDFDLAALRGDRVTDVRRLPRRSPPNPQRRFGAILSACSFARSALDFFSFFFLSGRAASSSSTAALSLPG